MFNHEKDEQREDYYYSLIYLFVPFRDKGNLLLANGSTEDAFHRLTNDKRLSHHQKLEAVLAAQSTITKINDAGHKTVEDENEESEEDNNDGPQLMSEANRCLTPTQ